MKFGKRFTQALPSDLAPFALPYTVRTVRSGRPGCRQLSSHVQSPTAQAAFGPAMRCRPREQHARRCVSQSYAQRVPARNQPFWKKRLQEPRPAPGSRRGHSARRPPPHLASTVLLPEPAPSQMWAFASHIAACYGLAN
jgi:hypothetical protein